MKKIIDHLNNILESMPMSGNKISMRHALETLQSNESSSDQIAIAVQNLNNLFIGGHIGNGDETKEAIHFINNNLINDIL